MSSKSYFSQLQVYAEKYIKGFIDDFYEIDRKNLQGYQGSLIWAVRDSGTNLILFGEQGGWWKYPGCQEDSKLPGPKGFESQYHYKAYQLRSEQLDLFDSWVFKKNDHFFLGVDGQIKRVSLDEARKFSHKNITPNTIMIS